ncbi:MAG: hypothetical protein ACK4GT_17915, partial [Pararhodobacter sp.]
LTVWRSGAAERVLRAGCLSFLLLAPGIALAEPDAESYQTGAGALTAPERAEMRARLAAEIAVERAREEAARRASEAEAERVATERAARPLGERLVEARCLTCHDAGQIDRIAYGTPGWTVTVARMEWLNGASLEPGERAVIVAHLAARHPDRNRVEWTLLTAMAAVIAAAGLGALIWMRTRRKQAP